MTLVSLHFPGLRSVLKLRELIKALGSGNITALQPIQGARLWPCTTNAEPWQDNPDEAPGQCIDLQTQSIHAERLTTFSYMLWCCVHTMSPPSLPDFLKVANCWN